MPGQGRKKGLTEEAASAIEQTGAVLEASYGLSWLVPEDASEEDRPGTVGR